MLCSSLPVPSITAVMTIDDPMISGMHAAIMPASLGLARNAMTNPAVRAAMTSKKTPTTLVVMEFILEAHSDSASWSFEGALSGWSKNPTFCPRMCRKHAALILCVKDSDMYANAPMSRTMPRNTPTPKPTYLIDTIDTFAIKSVFS